MLLAMYIGCGVLMLGLTAYQLMAGKIGRAGAIGGGIMAVASVVIGFSLELMPELSWPGTLFLIAGSVIVMFEERKKRTDSAK